MNVTLAANLKKFLDAISPHVQIVLLTCDDSSNASTNHSTTPEPMDWS